MDQQPAWAAGCGTFSASDSTRGYSDPVQIHIGQKMLGQNAAQKPCQLHGHLHGTLTEQIRWVELNGREPGVHVANESVHRR